MHTDFPNIHSITPPFQLRRKRRPLMDSILIGIFVALAVWIFLKLRHSALGSLLGISICLGVPGRGIYVLRVKRK